MSKLVRDKIPEIIIKNGQQPLTHIADPKEYYAALTAKLSEEVSEFVAAQNKEELADVLEVLLAICQYHSFSWKEIEAVRLQKYKERGGFTQRIILES